MDSRTSAISDEYAGNIDGDILAEVADINLACGRFGEAMTLYRHAIAAGTTIEVFERLAQASFPGPTYRDHLSVLHEQLKPKTYLEIGVFDGDTLALARNSTIAVGVDPAPRSTADRHYVAQTTIHRVTSDTYFDERAKQSGGPLPPIDFAFIDGLHHFDQVLRDFINLERICQSCSVVVIHDTLPVTAVSAQRERTSRYWCGDVWKIVPCLRRYRPDLTMITVPTFPSGLTILLGLKPGFAHNIDWYDEAIMEFGGLVFDDEASYERIRGQDPSLIQNSSAILMANVNAWLRMFDNQAMR
jgi:predicted O-methyltransferase YrrM